MAFVMPNTECGYVTKAGEPCTHPVNHGSTECAAGHPVNRSIPIQDSLVTTRNIQILEPSTLDFEDVFSSPPLNPNTDPYSHQYEAYDEVVPQANSIPKIVSVIDAIDNGLQTNKEISEDIGISERQGAYYPNAARSLGLVEKINTHPTVWGLTALGERVVEMNAKDRAIWMTEIVGENDYVNTLINNGAEALVGQWGSELGDSTIERRLATIESWKNFAYETEDSIQTQEIQTNMDEAKTRAPGIIAKRPPRAAPAVYCDIHFVAMTINGTLCPLCE